MIRGRLQLLVALLLLGLTTPAGAEVLLPGDSPSALPGVHRVGIIDAEQHRLTVAGSVGYGYTENVLGDVDRHYQVPMSLSVSYRPLSFLAVAVTQDIRYDVHNGPPDDGNDGWVLEPRVRLRGGWVSDFGLRLGGEVGVWFPASDSQSGVAAGTSVEMTALASYQPGDLPLLIALRAGFHLDRSGQGATNADALSRSDRLALGVSDSNALLLGLGVSWAVGPLEVLGEWSWDLYLGEDAPSPGQSPMRLTLGARFWVREALQVSLLGDITLSSRPTVAVGEPLVPVEPRFSVLVDVLYRFGFVDPPPPEILAVVVVDEEGEPVAGATVRVVSGRRQQAGESSAEGRVQLELRRARSRTLEVEAEGFHPQQLPLEPGEAGLQERRITLRALPATLRGRIRTAENAPVSGATVRITAGGTTRESTTDAEGRFEETDLPGGEVEVEAEAEGFGTSGATAQLAPGGEAEVTLQLEPRLPGGQLQGVVRTMDGTPLEAFILIQGERTPRRTNEDGTFDFTIPPGRYRLRIGLPGYREVRRDVVIDDNGVVMLNIDLRPARRRRKP